MPYCPDCGAEYRPEITQCAHCEGVALVENPPAPTAWDSEEAGWRVVMAGDEEADLAEASTRLEGAGVPHMIVRRREDATYLPPGADPDEFRPILFEEWDEAWLLVVPRPRFSAASHVLKAVEKEEEERQGDEQEFLEPAEQEETEADPDYRLPWDAGQTPASRMRKAFAVVGSAAFGLGSGLFLMRRYGQAIFCLAVQVIILFPAVAGLTSEVRYYWAFVLIRIIEFILVARAVIKQ